MVLGRGADAGASDDDLELTDLSCQSTAALLPAADRTLPTATQPPSLQRALPPTATATLNSPGRCSPLDSSVATPSGAGATGATSDSSRPLLPLSDSGRDGSVVEPAASRSVTSAVVAGRPWLTPAAGTNSTALRRGHCRSSSQGSPQPGPSILKMPGRGAHLQPHSAVWAEPVAPPNRRNARGHTRTVSHDQASTVKLPLAAAAGGGSWRDPSQQLSHHRRTGSRTDFILPPSSSLIRDWCDQQLHEPAGPAPASCGSRLRTMSRTSSLFGGHMRQASRTESVYTLRQPVQRSSSLMELLRRLWPGAGGATAGATDDSMRLLVPNHSVPPATPAVYHPNSGYCHNHVRTTKYTLLSFLPKNLFEQFHRFANLYFVLVILLNWLPQISAFGKELAMVPLLFVMGVTALKDLFEDRRRYNSDRRVNNATCQVYDRLSGEYRPRLWRQVRVGDIIHLSCDELIPADLLLLHCGSDSSSSSSSSSSSASSADDAAASDVCYVDTGNLDGETNLKPRRAVAGLREKYGDFHASKFLSVIECNTPTTKLYRFYGSVIHSSAERVPIGSDNLLLRESVLKNTDCADGIVVYAGNDTKALLNNGGPRYKRSQLERVMNLDIVYCALILLVLCLVGAIGSVLWHASYGGADAGVVPFLPTPAGPSDAGSEAPGSALYGFITFWTFAIILQAFVPISLYVTMEIIKLVQVYHINNDRHLYDPVTDRRVECRALNITEELGQIQYVFSDKTGTLTENQMVFRQCTVAGVNYNHDTMVDQSGKPAFIVNRVLYDQINSTDTQSLMMPSSMAPHLASCDAPQRLHSPATPATATSATPASATVSALHRRCLREFFLLLACCNTVVVAKHDHTQQQQQQQQQQVDTSMAGLTTSTKPDRHPLRMEPLYEEETTETLPQKLKKRLEISRPDWLMLPGMSRKSSSQSLSTLSAEERPLYEAESPDEMALVEAAYKYSVRLVQRTATRLTVALPGEGEVCYQILHVLPFDSDRKRMSIILRRDSTSPITMYTKGADSSMIEQLAPPAAAAAGGVESKEALLKTQQQMNSASQQGLRVLVMAKRELSDGEYNSWLTNHRQAESSAVDRDQKLSNSYRDIERNLTLLGCTGVEDRLQDGVADTLAALRAAGIVVWVLTGDKQETAVNIAHSCRLFAQNMQLIKLNARSRLSAERSINFYLKEITSLAKPAVHRKQSASFFGKKKNIATTTNNNNSGGGGGDSSISGSGDNVRWPRRSPKGTTNPSDHSNWLGGGGGGDVGGGGGGGGSVAPTAAADHAVPASTSPSSLQASSGDAQRALVVDGKTLTYFLDARTRLQKPFLQLASQCAAVMCCRTTPLQKACLVRLVKQQLHVLTLAIGDGANDVSMIQSADVGVGVSGVEGRQAVMAADFAVARFRFVRRLLLVHGHWCYDRLAKFLQYFLYKNATFLFTIFWYQMYCGFSGMLMVDQLYWSFFNLFFTSLPPFAIGIYDQSCGAELLLSRPALYSHGRESRAYRRHSFWLGILDALYQSIVILVVSAYTYMDTDVDILEFGTAVMVSCLYTMMLAASIEIRHWTWIHVASVLGSVLVFFSFALLYNSVCLYLPSLSAAFGTVTHALSTPVFYLATAVTPVAAVLPRFVVRVLKNSLWPSNLVQARLRYQPTSSDHDGSGGDGGSKRNYFKRRPLTNSHFQSTTVSVVSITRCASDETISCGRTAKVAPITPVV